MSSPEKIALLGFDCVLTSLLRKHIEEGICPHFKKIFDHGLVMENCLPPFPPTSSIAWAHLSVGTAHHNPQCELRPESFWEAAERGGKKGVLLNYPILDECRSALNATTIVGCPSADLSGEKREGITALAPSGQFSFCDTLLVTTEKLSGNIASVTLTEASDWENVDTMGDDPLEAVFEYTFLNARIPVSPATYYLLIRDLGEGYTVVTLSASKDFQKALFTVKTGEWAKAVDVPLLTANGLVHARGKAKLVSLDSSTGRNLRLYLPLSTNLNGEGWCSPVNKVKHLSRGDNIYIDDTGIIGLFHEWFEPDTWAEILALCYDWLGDATEVLLRHNSWDFFYNRAVPTEYAYYLLMTELDPETSSGRLHYGPSWEFHRELFKHADRYLGRLMALMDDSTLVTLVSPHGSIPAGFDSGIPQLLEKTGFLNLKKTDSPAFGLFSRELNKSFVVNGVKSKVLPGKPGHLHINIKDEEHNGIVERRDFLHVQKALRDILLNYVEPVSGQRPVCLALTQQEAMSIGLCYGDGTAGDIIYSLHPEFAGFDMPLMPNAARGENGTLLCLCSFYAPKSGIKQGVSVNRACHLADLVPTFCYLVNWPIPRQAEGAVLYQIMEDPDFYRG